MYFLGKKKKSIPSSLDVSLEEQNSDILKAQRAA